MIVSTEQWQVTVGFSALSCDFFYLPVTGTNGLMLLGDQFVLLGYLMRKMTLISYNSNKSQNPTSNGEKAGDNADNL